MSERPSLPRLMTAPTISLPPVSSLSSPTSTYGSSALEAQSLRGKDEGARHSLPSINEALSIPSLVSSPIPPIRSGYSPARHAYLDAPLLPPSRLPRPPSVPTFAPNISPQPPLTQSRPGTAVIQTHHSYSRSALEYDGTVEVRKAVQQEAAVGRVTYGDSVKRYLDIFDIETALNEVAEGSGQALEFSRHYGLRAHQSQRTGLTPGSVPSTEECDDILRHQHRVIDSISRIKDVLQRQQQALAEQRRHDQQLREKGPKDVDDELYNHHDQFDLVSASESKKRKGRAAPPGRCHSCNRAETPEWRRGPDGARTLCNACGLHYAKLTRRMGSVSKGESSGLRARDGSP